MEERLDKLTDAAQQRARITREAAVEVERQSHAAKTDKVWPREGNGHMYIASQSAQGRR